MREIEVAKLRWTETLDDGEPTGLTGTLYIDVEDDGQEAGSLTTLVSGPPETLDAQLDRALGAAGWERVGDIHSWPTSGTETTAAGQCAVRRLGPHPGTVEAEEAARGGRRPQEYRLLIKGERPGRTALLASRHADDLEISAETAGAIWDVLREHGLTPTDPWWREQFLAYAGFHAENRDQGLLRCGVEYRLFFASGVKFRAEANHRGWRVSCYPEERTADLDARIAAANAALTALERETTGGDA